MKLQKVWNEFWIKNFHEELIEEYKMNMRMNYQLLESGFLSETSLLSEKIRNQNENIEENWNEEINRISLKDFKEIVEKKINMEKMLWVGVGPAKKTLKYISDNDIVKKENTELGEIYFIRYPKEEK